MLYACFFFIIEAILYGGIQIGVKRYRLSHGIRDLEHGEMILFAGANPREWLLRAYNLKECAHAKNIPSEWYGVFE